MDHENLLAKFQSIALKFPNNIALSIDECEYRYSELHSKIQEIAGWIHLNITPNNSRIGILTNRDISGYVSIYGAVWAGATFVPLNPKMPIERLERIIGRADLIGIIYDESCCEVFEHISYITNGVENIKLVNGSPNYDESKAGSLKKPVNTSDSDPAYLMFTSGTTGEPKGILATVGNMKQYLNFMQQRYQIKSSDRLSQVFELTFDASIFDLFMSANNGASFHTVPENQLLAPGVFIKEKMLTIWFGVPSHISFMNKMGLLVPGNFPNLRISVFGGEPMPKSSMEAWRMAAPNSKMDNVYGPTEATVTCFVQECNDTTPVTEDREVMSIGRPYDGMCGAIVDEVSSFLGLGEKGELVVSGPQVTSGYWLDEKLTHLKFRELDHPKFGKKRWYFTGDLAYEDNNDVFHHLGRMDNQIKLSGYRVELEEIDAALRRAACCDAVAAVPWPMEQGSARGIVAFICGSKEDLAVIREKMLDILPQYMVPRRFIISESLPYTLNGKVDRKLLAEKLDKEFRV